MKCTFKFPSAGRKPHHGKHPLQRIYSPGFNVDVEYNHTDISGKKICMQLEIGFVVNLTDKRY